MRATTPLKYQTKNYENVTLWQLPRKSLTTRKDWEYWYSCNSEFRLDISFSKILHGIREWECALGKSLTPLSLLSLKKIIADGFEKIPKNVQPPQVNRSKWRDSCLKDVPAKSTAVWLARKIILWQPQKPQPFTARENISEVHPTQLWNKKNNMEISGYWRKSLLLA